MDVKVILISAYITSVLIIFIIYGIMASKGYRWKKPDDYEVVNPYILMFLPAANFIFLFSLLIDYKFWKDDPKPNYEVKYKLLTKALIAQNVYTEEEIKELEDSASLIDKLLV